MPVNGISLRDSMKRRPFGIIAQPAAPHTSACHTIILSVAQGIEDACASVPYLITSKLVVCIVFLSISSRTVLTTCVTRLMTPW